MERPRELLGGQTMTSWFRPRRKQLPAMTLEGVLGPNGRLDAAAGMRVEAPDAICVGADGRLLASSGSRVLAFGAWGQTPEAFAPFDARVTALSCSPGGVIAVGLADGTLAVRDGSGQTVEGWVLPAGRVASIVDCAFASDDEIVLVDCGYRADDNVLALAAWDETARGQIVSLRRSGEARTILSGLHCPMGLCIDESGSTLVALLERATIVDQTGAVRQGGYPGYLGRLRRTPAGYALACLSRRDPLIEFLKTEPGFIAAMKAKIEPRHWIAPRANPEFSHDFPIELGATRLYGEVKPWAPSFSYGLLIETDAVLMPTGSAQSRANGQRHAISDIAVWNGDLITVSRASGEILNLGAMP